MVLSASGPGFVIAGLLSKSIGTIVSTVLSLIVRWVGSGAAAVVVAVGGTLESTSRPVLQAGFSSEYALMIQIGLLISAPILVLAVIWAVVRQDLGFLAKMMLVRLPVSVLLSAIAVTIVRLALTGVDELSSLVLQAAGGSAQSLLGVVVSSLAALGTVGAPIFAFKGFAALLFAVLAAGFALLLWLELVVRSAAVAVATLFLPLALAGFALPLTAHWARRLVETLVALVLSKLVIVSVIALAATTIASVGTTGISGGVEGVAMLMLASLTPFTLLRLIPMFEAGAAGHLEGIGRRPLHLADPTSQGRRTGTALMDLFDSGGPAMSVTDMAGSTGGGSNPSNNGYGGPDSGGSPVVGPGGGRNGGPGGGSASGGGLFEGIPVTSGIEERASEISRGLRSGEPNQVAGVPELTTEAGAPNAEVSASHLVSDVIGNQR